MNPAKGHETEALESRLSASGKLDLEREIIDIIAGNERRDIKTHFERFAVASEYCRERVAWYRKGWAVSDGFPDRQRFLDGD